MEKLRRAVRGAIGYDSRLYRAGAGMLNASVVIAREGFATWRRLQSLQNHPDPQAPAVALKLRKLTHPILLRHDPADATSILNNAIREEYGQFAEPASPRWIVDAGAYIGDTGAYFLSRFPEARLVALEPNPESHAQATRNLEPYGDRATVLRKGLWSQEARLRFGGKTIGASIREEGIEIETISVPALMDRYGMDHLDILKMDVEGAEERVLAPGAESWLRKVGLIIIEIHGPAIFDRVAPFLREQGFEMRQFRSLWYCRRVGADEEREDRV